MQNRTGAITLILLLAAWWLHGQSCPVVIGATEVNLPNGMTKACAGIDLQIKTTVTNITPTTSLEVYSGNQAGFDPTKGEGTLLETFAFNQVSCQNPTCPTLIGAMINACVSESNEYLTFNSGSGLAVNDLSIVLDEGNKSPMLCASGCDDLGSSQCPFSSTPAVPNVGCNIIPAKPGDIIPPNALVIVLMSADFNANAYDWSALCKASKDFSTPVYVLQNSCSRGIGAFTDMPNSTKSYSIQFCGGCQNTISYSQSIQEGSFYLANNSTRSAGCIIWPDPGLQPLTFNVPIDATICTSAITFIKIVWKQGTTVCSIITPNGSPIQIDCPAISIQGDMSYCEGSTLALTGQGNFSSWKWKSGSFQSNGRSVLLNNQQGTFTLTGTTSNKCIASTSIDVIRIPLPGNDLQFFPSSTVCLNNPVTIQAASADTYAWSTGETDQRISRKLSEDLDFSVTLTNAGKCSAEVSGQVTVDPSPSCLAPLVTCPDLKFTTFNDTFCFSEMLFDTIELNLPFPPGDSVKFRWHGPGIIDSTNRFVPYLTQGGGTFVDTVEITLNDTCHYTVLDTIVLLDATVTFLTPDTICLGNFYGAREIAVHFTGDAPYTLTYFLDEDFGTQYLFQTDAQNDTIRDFVGSPSKVQFANFISNNRCTGRLLSRPEIHFTGTISSESILVDCFADTAWRATITMDGDTSNSYGFSGAQAMRIGNKIITEPIPVGQDLHLKIWTGAFDVCDTVDIQHTAPNCSCITAASALQGAGDTIYVCPEVTGSQQFIDLGGYVNDGDDGLFYILYTGRADSIGTILFQSNFYAIDWDQVQKPLAPGYYYFSAAASTDKGSGFDPGDYCAKVSPPVIIAVRTPPTATISGDIVACQGTEPEIMLDLTGTAPFAIAYERNGTPQNIQASTPNFSFRVLANRDITLKLTGLKDNFCEGIVSGEVHITTIAQDTTDYERTLCINDTLTIGNETFYMAKPDGFAVLPGAAQGGCDSIMRVMLHFTTPDTIPIRQELCPGDTLTLAGETFFAGHLSGLVSGSSGMACDTIFDVRLTLYPGLVDTVLLNLCPGDTVNLAGEHFHSESQSSLVHLPAQSVNGCDSMLYVVIIPHSPTTTIIRESLCTGDFRMYGGERFDANRPSGSLIAGQDVFGCDSMLDIQLTYVPIPVGMQEIALCPGEIIEIAGVFFSETHLSDTVLLAGESHLGCDSMVVVSAELLKPTTSYLTMDLCNGSELVINGHLYNEAKPSGMEVLPGANAQGCDSIIQVDLHFTDAVHFLLNDAICPGDFVFVDTALFDANRPNGHVLLSGASRFGCDSIVDVSLQVVAPTTHQLLLTLCPGDFLVVNGIRYDANHPAGTEILPGANHLGCDSIIEINLTFDTLKIQAQPTSAGCQSNTEKMLEITSLANGQPPYRFRINGGPQLGIPSLPFQYPVPDTTTTLTLQVMDQNGCEASTIVSFQDTSAQAFVSLGPNREVMLGEPVTIQLETNVTLTSYTMYLPDGTTCQNCLPMTMDLLQTGAFRIRAQDAQGCTYTDDVTIIVSETSRLFIPNIFSPDGDGQNDELRLYPGSNLVLIHSFVIRDVWGEIVFEAHAYYPDAGQPVWDGTFKGKMLNPGVFHYFVDAEFSNGSRRLLDGDITLIR